MTIYMQGHLYDITPLVKKSSSGESYFIEDGESPCDEKAGKSFSYFWNFCDDVPTDKSRSCGNATCAVLQYDESVGGKTSCKCIGVKENTKFDYINKNDPSAGIILTYSSLDECQSGKASSTVIEISCANTRSQLISASELSPCEHRIVMNSYYGCPKVCKYLLLWFGIVID